MRVKIWVWRFLLRWTPKARAIRKLARELKISESKAFALVNSFEASVKANIISIVQEFILDERRKALEAAQKASAELPKNLPPRYPTYPDRPRNQQTAGARLASNR